MTSYKILITGARSKTAQALINFFRNETVHELVLLSKEAKHIDNWGECTKYSVDILDINKLKKICYAEQPDFIINTHSFNNILEAERHKKITWDANVVATENFVSISRVLDCTLIQISCVHIFNGKNSPYFETNAPDPLNYYGKSKHAAENACLARHHKSVIVRCCPIYGYSSFGSNDFLSDTLYSFSKNNSVLFSSTYKFSPTFTDDIARVINKIIDKKRLGIYNCGGPELLSHKDILIKIANIFDINNYTIKNINHNLLFSIPTIENAGLVNLKAETDLGIRFTSFENGLYAIKNKMQKANNNLF